MPQENEIIRAGQIEVRFLLESKDTSGQLVMFEFTVPASAKVPAPHSHTHYDETIYGLEGVMTFTVNGQPMGITAGDTYFIPRGGVHGFNNLKSASAKGLAVVTPALIGPEFFREMAAIVNAGGLPDLEKIKAVMTKHGLVPALQPMGASLANPKGIVSSSPRLPSLRSYLGLRFGNGCNRNAVVGMAARDGRTGMAATALRLQMICGR